MFIIVQAIIPVIKMSNSKNMSFLSSAVFWGAIIILFGLSIILREIFHIHIPFVRIIFGFILLYWGIKMIAGGFNRNGNDHSAIFRESNMKYDGKQREYNVIFGNGTIDLFRIENNSTEKIEVNVVFGSGVLILNDSIPTRVSMNAVFGSVSAPDKSTNGFGESVYTTSVYKEGSPYVKVECNAVFGRVVIQNQRW
jgi:hypothetical protein